MKSILPLNRQLVERASRLLSGRFALELSTAGETPDAAGGTPAPLFRPSGSGAPRASRCRGILARSTLALSGPCLCSSGLAAASDAAHRLWYSAPAAKWTEALPIGNGRLGAMVFGGAEHERLQLNENTLTSDEPGYRTLPLDVRKDFATVTNLIAQRRFAEADALVTGKWLGRGWKTATMPTACSRN